MVFFSMANYNTIRGVLVLVDGTGVLIRGRSGSGKSLTALGLMQRGHRLVADDIVVLVDGPDGSVVGRSLEERVRIEVRGLGVFEAASLIADCVATEAEIDLVVDLDDYDPARDDGRISADARQTDIMGRTVTAVRLPLADRVDASIFVELLARLSRSGLVTI